MGEKRGREGRERREGGVKSCTLCHPIVVRIFRSKCLDNGKHNDSKNQQIVYSGKDL